MEILHANRSLYSLNSGIDSKNKEKAPKTYIKATPCKYAQYIYFRLVL